LWMVLFPTMAAALSDGEGSQGAIQKKKLPPHPSLRTSAATFFREGEQGAFQQKNIATAPEPHKGNTC